jgi:hypothetical protein
VLKSEEPVIHGTQKDLGQGVIFVWEENRERERLEYRSTEARI